MARLLDSGINFLFSWRLLIFSGAILLLMLPAYFTDKHFLYNLEPYPDGLLYSLSARNAAISSELGLRYKDSFIPFWVPPVYSLLLIPVYIFNINPTSFFLANIALLIISLYFFDKILNLFSINNWLHLGGLSIFLLHGYLLWLPLVPMSENATVPLFMILVFSLLKRKNIFWLIASITSLLLIFTRYAMVGVAMSSVMLMVIHFITNVSKISQKKILSCTVLIILATSIGYLVVNRYTSIIQYVFDDAVSGQVFYGSKYFWGNFKSYFTSLLGLPGTFLWRTDPLSTFAISIPAFSYIIYKTIKKSFVGLALLSLLGGIVIPPLLFYTTDNRYIVLTLPIISLAFVLAAHDAVHKKIFARYILAVASIVLLVISQMNIYKELVIANLLHRTAAWQYEAVKHFNSRLVVNDYLVTALPPHLVSAYQTQDYTLLPLSSSQEFLQHKQYVWGDNINYDQLAESYKNFIGEGKSLYITNSYITHQHVVINDYEKYKSDFELHLVSEGCLSACNIYKLSLKEPAN